MKYGPYLSRQQALTYGARFYLGKDCPRGHGGIRTANAGCNCFECEAIHKAKYAESGAQKAYFQEYYRINCEGLKAVSRQHSRAQRDRIIAKLRAKYWANPAEARAKRRLWSLQNPGAKGLSDRRSYIKHRDKRLAYSKWQKAVRRGAEGVFTKADLEVIFERQAGRCAYCRTDLALSCEVDHIKPIARGGNNWPANLQMTCRKCNRMKSDRDPMEFAAWFASQQPGAQGDVPHSSGPMLPSTLDASQLRLHDDTRPQSHSRPHELARPR